jgi:hypothetical protein
LETFPNIVRVGSRSGPFKGARFSRTDRGALMIALIIAGGAAYVWLLGMIGLWGRPELNFDRAIITWLTETELALALPAWLLLRAANAIMRMRTGRHP